MGSHRGHRRVRFLGDQGRPGGSGAWPRDRGLFGLLDSYYLREERLFRCLYDEARTGAIEVYSMKKDAYAARYTRRQVIHSWSVLGFYGPLLLVGLGALAWSIWG